MSQAHRPSFLVVPGHPMSSVVLHVPHASTYVPDDARSSIVLDDDALRAELAAMTDHHTDLIATEATARLSERVLAPWVFVNRCSRLTVDPERFTDDSEEMLAVGMGAVYTGTSTRGLLRPPDAERDRQLVASYFEPYADALAALVDDRLAATGRATLVDVHSFPRRALPYELHADQVRPEICLGVDADHTPADLLAAARSAFAEFHVEVNQPFAGTYVPTRHHRMDLRVASLMVEIRRDTYMAEPDGPTHDGLGRVVRALADFLSAEGCATNECVFE